MDPSVVAALITTPTAVLAAATAYAAGRAQARSAHRGPVDAIRRQHQRDAYAAFLIAAQTLADETNYPARANEVARQQAASNEPTPDGPLWQMERALRLMSEADTTALRSRAAVVSLEGPAPIAVAAAEVEEAARHTVQVARATLATVAEWLPNANELMQPNRKLRQAIRAFIVAARDHLNTHD